MVPLLILFFLVIIPQTILQISNPGSDPHRMLLYFYLIMVAFYAYVFIRFALQYRTLRNRAD